MMIVTDIKKQVHNKNKVSIFVDDNYYDSFFDETYISSKIKIGDELTDDQFLKIKLESEKKLSFNKSLDYIAHRMRAISEVRQYLKRKDFCDEAIDYAIDKLYEYKYIDDKKFANAYTKDRINIKLKGKRYILAQLNKYKIDKEIIQSIEDEYDYDKEYENAQKLVIKLNKKHVKEENKYKRVQKISAAMARMGYDWDTIKTAINENSSDNYDE